MPIWKEQSAALKDAPVATSDSAVKKETESRIDHAPSVPVPPAVAAVPHRAPERALKESLIAEELTIEGKIEGTGHVRIAGRFKGDVSVKGNLAIEAGATLTGGVRANTVTIGGQVDGNIDGASRVELLETGILNGDLSADSLTVAAGSRMRGKVEFGWDKNERQARSAERAQGASKYKADSTVEL
jgi:cytoskeletal protein CcmA (bactofilin family)